MASLGVKTTSSTLLRNLPINGVKRDKVEEYKVPSMEQEFIFPGWQDFKHI